MLMLIFLLLLTKEFVNCLENDGSLRYIFIYTHLFVIFVHAFSPEADVSHLCLVVQEV